MKIPNNFNQEMIKKLKATYPILSKNEILSNFPGYKWRNLQNIANELKLKKTYSEIRNGKIQNLFNQTNESYYWLGLIATDGTILKDGTLKVELCINDKEYLSKMALFLETILYTYPKYKSSKIGGKGTCRIKIKDIEQGIKLRNLFKIVDKKTYNPISLDFITNIEHFISFLIGFIDGDGSISKKGYISIDCHKNYKPIFELFIHKLSSILNKEDFTILFYKDMIRLNFKSKASKLLKNKLYELQVPFMERKWSRI